MGFRAIEPVQITGLLSAPDATLANGWNNVDISTITTIPAPATAVLFYFVNDSTSSRTVGIRHANDNSNSVYASGSFAGAKYAHVIATLESPSGSTFGFNTNANTSVKFFVAGFFHDITVLEPQNRISSATSTGTWQTKTINELPNGTNFILNFSNRFGTAFGNRWREVGGTEEYPVQGMSFIKVNPNKQFQVNLESSGSVSIGGYSSANWVQFVANVTSNSMANTTWSANSNWNDFPLTYPGKTGIVAFLHTNGTDGYNSGAAAFLRKKGSSWSIARAGNAGSEHGGYVIEPDANGQFQYWIEGGVANTGSIAVSTFFTETVPDYTLTDVNTTESVVAGQDSVVFSGRGLSTVDKIRIASNTRSISKNVTSANLTTVIASIPTDSELFSSNVAFGNVTFSVEVSGNAVANLSGTLALSEQYGQHDVINVSQNTNSNTIYFAQTPAVKVGDKIAHESATHTYGWGATIDSNGFISVGSSYSTQSDNLSYRIYSSDFEQWSTSGAITIQSPYINARANSVRVAKSADGKRYSKFPSGDYANNSLTWSAANLSDNTTLTITTDGTYNFGSIGPTLLYYDDYSGVSNNTVASITPKLGRGSVSNNSTGAPLVYDASEMPYGKGLVIGAEGTNQNDTNYRQFRVVDSQTSTEFFEWFYHYYPTTNQNNAQPYLYPNSTWQVKGIWHFYGPDGYSSNTKSDIFGGTQLLYTATGNYTSGYKWGSNDPPISTFDTSSSGLRGATSSSYLRSNPLLRQHWVKASPLGTQPNGSDGMYRIVDSVDGEIESKDYYNIGYFDSGSATQSGYDRFNLPGYVRGYLKTYGAHMYYGQIYQAVGAGAAARVEIGNSSDYKTATKLSICTVQSWSSTQIQIKIRTGIFYNEGVANLWFYIHNSNNDLVATGRLV